MDIAQIVILKGNDAGVFGVQGSGGAILINTKRGIPNKPIPSLHVQTISLLGYQRPAAFYAPKYDTPEKRLTPVPDLRTTIHWQPAVKTDPIGVASFEFYNADEQTSYTMTIEGLTEEGKIIFQKKTLWTKE